MTLKIVDNGPQRLYTQAADEVIQALRELPAPLPALSMPPSSSTPLCVECRAPVYRTGPIVASNTAWILNCHHILDGTCAYDLMSSAVFFEDGRLEEFDGSVTFQWKCPVTSCEMPHVVVRDAATEWRLDTRLVLWAP